ncbi:hypothetical protein Tco_0944702 [Tanacetum coccineum]
MTSSRGRLLGILQISTQADGAQSSRVPVPLPEDHYEAIGQTYLDGMDTESEPFEDLVESETPESPLTVTPPTSQPESNSIPATCFPLLRNCTYGCTRSTCNVIGPLCQYGRGGSNGTSELVEDRDEDDDEEDEKIEESLDFDRSCCGDEGLGMGVESRGLDNEGHSVESDGLSLGEEEEAVPEGQQQAALVVGTAVSAPLGLGYRVLRCQELTLEEDHRTLTTWIDPEDGMVYIDVPAYPPPPPVQTPPLPEWTSGSFPISTSPFIVPSPISSPMIPLTIPCPVATPDTDETLSPTLFERYDRDIRELFTRSGAVRDEIFSQRYWFRSLEHKQERVAVTFGALWRPVLALESWEGHTDAQRAALWHAISDT